MKTAPTRSLLLDRDFALIWVAGLISITGNLAMFVALPVAVYQRTGSTLATSFTALTGLAPSVVVGQVGGVVVDRIDRRSVLIMANLVLAASNDQNLWMVPRRGGVKKRTFPRKI